MERGRLLIDANLLVLLVIGITDRNQIERFRRTRQYEQQDFDLLSRMARAYNQVVATPNVLTEASNLAGQLSGRLRQKAFGVMAGVIQQLDEPYIDSRVAVRDQAYLRLGLTDAGLHLLESDVTVVTDDLDLYVSLSNRGANVVNFTHLRAAGWNPE